MRWDFWRAALNSRHSGQFDDVSLLTMLIEVVEALPADKQKAVSTSVADQTSLLSASLALDLLRCKIRAGRPSSLRLLHLY